jgi:aminodeoxychorismate lyase
MIVFLNGKFVPENRAVVSVFDRGFLYGDALFESLLVTRGRPFCWDMHMARLQSGVSFLELAIPYSWDQLRQFALQLIARNKMPEGMLRLTISRGITGRTYSPQNAARPAVVMTLHPAPVIHALPRWPVITAPLQLMANDPLSLFKTANKLPQIVARAATDAARAREALFLNTAGRIAEGTTGNVFWIKNNVVCTPALPDSALPGVTRALVLDLCVKMNIKCRQKKARLPELRQSDGAFLTMSSLGIVEIASLDGLNLKRSPLVQKLWVAYRALLQSDPLP